MTEYSLAQITLASGLLKAYLYVDDTVPALTVPTTTQFVDIGEFVETLDVDPAVIDFENVHLRIADDYSTYAEGFWWKVINGYTTDVQIMFTLTEGSTERFLFRGSVYRPSVKFVDHYINSTDKVRSADVMLVSLAAAFKTVSMTDLAAAIKANTVDNYSGKMISIKGIMSIMVSLAYGQAYSADYCIDSADDIRLLDIDLTQYTWSELFIYVQDSLGADVGFFNVAADNRNAWELKYTTAFDLMQMICKTFCFFPRYTYGDGSGNIVGGGSDRHYIEFISFGNDSANVATFKSPVPIDSGIISESVNKTNLVKASTVQQIDQPNLASGADPYWGVPMYSYSNGVEVFDTNIQDGLPGGIPKALKFIIDENTDFNVRWSYGAHTDAGDSNPHLFDINTHLYGFWPDDTVYPGALWPMVAAAYRDYSDDPTVPTVVNNHQTVSRITPPLPLYVLIVSSNNLISAIAGFLFGRYSMKKYEYICTYGSIQASVGSGYSQINVHTLMRTEITDLINGSAVTNKYYAREVRKDIVNNRATITWVQE